MCVCLRGCVHVCVRAYVRVYFFFAKKVICFLLKAARHFFGEAYVTS